MQKSRPHEDEIGLLKIKSLSVELFADFESEFYFEGFPMSVHAESSPSEKNNTSEKQTCSLTM